MFFMFLINVSVFDRIVFNERLTIRAFITMKPSRKVNN